MAQPNAPTELHRLQPAVRVDASAEVGPGMIIHFRLHNEGDRAIYVYDRGTWGGPGGARIDDPEAPYRFVRDGRLRILYGDCPLPQRMFVTTHHVSVCTRIEPGASLERVARVPAPIVEHSAYWSATAFKARPAEAQRITTEPVRCVGIDLLVDCLVDQPGLVQKKPALDGGVEFERSLVALQHAVRLHQPIRTAEFAALRRPEIDARPLLAGESPEPFRRGEQPS